MFCLRWPKASSVASLTKKKFVRSENNKIIIKKFFSLGPFQKTKFGIPTTSSPSFLEIQRRKQWKIWTWCLGAFGEILNMPVGNSDTKTNILWAPTKSHPPPWKTHADTPFTNQRHSQQEQRRNLWKAWKKRVLLRLCPFLFGMLKKVLQLTPKHQFQFWHCFLLCFS